MQPTRRDVLVATALCLASLAASAISLFLAEFGAPVWIFVALLAWLLSFGLPTLASVLCLAWLWPGPSLQLYVVAVATLAFLLHLGVTVAIRRAFPRGVVR